MYCVSLPFLSLGQKFWIIIIFPQIQIINNLYLNYCYLKGFHIVCKKGAKENISYFDHLLGQCIMCDLKPLILLTIIIIKSACKIGQLQY